MNAFLEYGDIWLIGGGGKTTLMFRLASAWAARGERVICTTTTKIWPHETSACPDVRIGDFPSIVTGLRERPAPMIVVVSRLEQGKCHGFSAEEAFSLKPYARRLIVEADGSAERPIKAHAPHEPVVAAGASCVIGVVGGWCVGAPLDAVHVHRPERFSAITGRPIGETVTAEDVARVILDDAGWIHAVPPGAAFHVVVTGADGGIVAALSAHPKAGKLTGIHHAPKD
ncbi:MAG TPA: selenium cofactor biosynthesis protein YqeC [Candidatus Ozemobacteraceae bacterium]|mgnify:CR=1 FL=1|nr:selenium cofactor biosynthesis protein YqeC [Candidatus Ozemobacteraceae bacterium]